MSFTESTFLLIFTEKNSKINVTANLDDYKITNLITWKKRVYKFDRGVWQNAEKDPTFDVTHI